MIGAILGDIIGSPYEFSDNRFKNIKILDGTHLEIYEFTDDTVMTVAVADCILNNLDPVHVLQQYGRKYPGRSYGGMFARWIEWDNPKPYNSYGNGAAMRISPVGFLPGSLEEKFKISDFYTSITHNHPEGIKGARSIVDAMHKILFENATKESIKSYIQSFYGYNLENTVGDLRLTYSFDETCQGTIPQAFICFLESTDFEDAIKNAVSIGGDADTLGAIVGGLAECYYEDIPSALVDFARIRLDSNLLSILDSFEQKYGKFY